MAPLALCVLPSAQAAPAPEPQPKPALAPALANEPSPSSDSGVTSADGVSNRKLKDVERQLEESRQRQKKLAEQAKALAEEVKTLRQNLIDAASKAQDSEETLSSLETRLKTLRQRETALKDELGARDTQLRQVLMALERVALRPPEAVLVQPTPPADSIRSAILLRSAVPELTAKAKVLRGELDKLQKVRHEISLRRTDIALMAAKLDKQNSRLTALFERKQALQRSTEEQSQKAADRADALAKDASSMRDLLARLEQERKRREAEERKRREEEARRAAEEARRVAALVMAKPEVPRPPAAHGDTAAGAGTEVPVTPGLGGAQDTGAVPPAKVQAAVVHAPSTPLRPMTKMRGLMPLPARGRIVARYGQQIGVSGTRKGIEIQTRERAQVIAPADGVVAFAGSFRGYGLLLIMEHGGGYHTLLSGLGHIDVAVGQRLLMGEPVGVMSSEDTPTLYLELRHDGQPINPMPWLTARKG